MNGRVTALRWVGPLLILLLGALLIWLLISFNNTQANQHREVLRNHRLAVAIQRSRYDAALRGCQDQNRRHDAAVKFLTKLEQHGKLSQEGLREFETFIGALAPRVSDCAKKAHLVVSRP